MAGRDDSFLGLQTVGGARSRRSVAEKPRAEREPISDEELDHILDEEEPRWAGLLDRLAR